MFYILNNLKILGKPEQVKAVMDFIIENPASSDETEKIDFDKIVPTPEELKIKESDNAWDAHFLLFGDPLGFLSPCGVENLQERFSRFSPDEQQEAVELALIYQRNYKKYGHINALCWRVENWGTRSNGIIQHITDGAEKVSFLTEELAPVPVIIELSRIFPKVKFAFDFLDEDYFISEEKPVVRKLRCYLVLKNGRIISSDVFDVS
jgi:hypothetical protein